MRRELGIVLRLWPWVMSLAVCAPLLAPGYVLSYDMVWVPRLDIARPEVWGLGSALPRAVPSDAVVALLNLALPGQVVQKVILVGALGLAGAGAIRLLPDASVYARLACATWYVWNPFVAERLVLGHWPLIVAYAAFPWLIRAVLALRHTSGGSWPAIGLTLAATAISPASGLMGVVLAWCCLVGTPVGDAARRAAGIGAAALAVNAPWLVAGLLRTGAARSDPAAVALFDLQPEAHLGRLGAALSLGGVWNADVVPDSRSLVSAPVLVVLLWAFMLVGTWTLWRGGRALPVVPLVVAAAVGLLVAVGGWVATGVVEQVVEAVPGGGLLRDGSRYLALLAPLQAVLFGLGVGRLAVLVKKAGPRGAVAAVAIVLPLVAMPDLAWGATGALKPADYPSSWAEARLAIERAPQEGAIAVVPFTAYRAPDWNGGRPVLDPAGRFFDRTTVVSDELVISGRAIAGEDPRARRVGRILGGDAVAYGLAREGIGFVVYEADAGDSGINPLERAGLDRIFARTGVQVYAIPDARLRAPGMRQIVVVSIAWSLALGAVAGWVALGIRSRIKGHRVEAR